LLDAPLPTDLRVLHSREQVVSSARHLSGVHQDYVTLCAAPCESLCCPADMDADSHSVQTILDLLPAAAKSAVLQFLEGDEADVPQDGQVVPSNIRYFTLLLAWLKHAVV